MHYLFDIQWFIKHQRKLLWLLNTPIIRIWFRWVMRIKKYDCNEKITEIMPNNFSFRDKIVSIYSDDFKNSFNGKGTKKLYRQAFNNYKKNKEFYVLLRTTDFRSHNKYSKRLYYAFKPLWYCVHGWDMVVNALRLPVLNFGFDTLTVYPDAHPETTSVDGSTTRNNVLDTWAGIREGNGREAAAGNSADYVVYLISSGTSDRWDTLYRDAFLFDTSSLTDTVTINSATFSLYGTGVKSDAFSQSITLVSSNPNSNTELVSADYPIGRWGSTEFATRLAISSWNTSAYNDFSLNSNGIANISKTSISKFGTRISADFDNSPPIWQNVASSYARSYFAERTGTSQDPKLVVEYSVPVVSNPMQIIIFM